MSTSEVLAIHPKYLSSIVQTKGSNILSSIFSNAIESDNFSIFLIDKSKGNSYLSFKYIPLLLTLPESVVDDIYNKYKTIEKESLDTFIIDKIVDNAEENLIENILKIFEEDIFKTKLKKRASQFQKFLATGASENKKETKTFYEELQKSKLRYELLTTKFGGDLQDTELDYIAFNTNDEIGDGVHKGRYLYLYITHSLKICIHKDSEFIVDYSKKNNLGFSKKELLKMILNSFIIDQELFCKILENEYEERANNEFARGLESFTKYH